MNDPILTISIALGGLIMGHLISRFWDRARPLVVGKGYSTVQMNIQKVVVSDEASMLTKQSWFMDGLSEGESTLKNISTSYLSAGVFLNKSEGIDTWIREAKVSFEKAESANDLRSAFKQLIHWSAISDLIEIGLIRQQITIPKKTYEGEPSIATARTKDGEFVFVFENSVIRFGTKLNIETWREPLLTPFVEAASFGDKDAIISVLNQLPKLAHEQSDIHRRIKELMEPIRNENSRWVSYISVLNYGNSPMIIWPQCKITIVSKKGGGKFYITGYLVRITKTKNGKEIQEDLMGPHIIPSNVYENFWVISNDTESAMNQGSVIRAHFKSGDCLSHISVNIGSRSIPWKQRVRCSSIVFKQDAEPDSR